MKANEKSSGAGVLTGAVVGLAVGAAAVILSKKQNRNKIKTHIHNMLEVGEDTIQDTKDSINDLKDKARNKVSQEMKKTSEKLADVSKKTKA